MLGRLGCCLDTVGAGRRLRDAETGWASRSCDDLAAYDTGKIRFRYRARGEGRRLCSPLTRLSHWNSTTIFSIFMRRISA